MKRSTLTIVPRQIAELKASEYNPRMLTKPQFEQIKKSIQEFGFVDPVIINRFKGRENVIIGGHQRVNVAKELGIRECPCIELNLPPDRERELNIRLNKNVGEWDYDLLANNFDLEELRSFGFEEWELPGTPDVKEEARTFGKGEIKEVEKVVPNEAKCPKCGHVFAVVLTRNMKLGKTSYESTVSSISGEPSEAEAGVAAG